MDEQKQHVIDTLKEANNILVTVRNGPSIDQLAACIALTIVLNELGKHGTAVFSGRIPASLDFLEPEKTIERNTNSLQDFIISLDKAKADKLRYKIEDTVVKIFITPYRTSLSQTDLTFEPGDFNVDVVVALGIHNQDDVDEAITEHGKILHDATVLSINNQGGASAELGSVAWIDERASSLSEMVAGIVTQLGKEDVLDNQVATALLTGIVAETERFGNGKTTPAVMEVAAKLLTAGANQELVAARLAEPAAEPESLPAPAEEPDLPAGAGFIPQVSEPSPVAAPEQRQPEPGTLEIDHPVTPLSASIEADKPFGAAQTAGVLQAAAPEMAPPAPALVAEAAAAAPTATEDITSLLNQPAAEPAAPAPVADGSSAPNGGNDEQAALDFLKDHKVDSRPRAFLEPLPEQKIEPIHSGVALPDVPAEPASPADILGQATRPSLGGTLTANVPNEHDASALNREAAMHAAEAPLLSHGKPSGDALIAPLISAADQQKAAEAHAPTLAELERQVHAHNAVSNPAAAVPTPEQAAALITPLIDNQTAMPTAPQTVTMPLPTAVAAAAPADAAPQPAAPRQAVPPVPPPLPVVPAGR